MVDTKRYTPSNKRFQEHTKHFVEGTTKKGHLAAKDKGDKKKETGELKQVEVAKIYENGWLVEDSKKKRYYCSYGDNIIYLPPHTVNADGRFYIPKKKCKVEFSIDEKSKIYTITKINDANKQPISMTNNGVKLEGSGLAFVEIKGDDVNISGNVKGDSVNVSGDIKGESVNASGSINGETVTASGTISSAKDIKINTTNDDDLPDEISVKDLYKQVQVLQQQVSDNNGSG